VTPRAPAAALVLAAALLAAPAAHANGRVPMILSVEARPDVPDTILLGSTFGLVASTDRGASWGWVCEAALGYMGIFDPHVASAASGTWLVTLFASMARSADGGCTWTPPAGIDGAGGSWRAVAAHPTVPGTFYAANGGDSGAFALWVSTDDGLSFAPTTLASTAQYYDGIAVSPADPARLYVGSWYPTPPQGFVHASDDGGATWTTTEHTTATTTRLRVLGTSATDPDVVLWLNDGMTNGIWRSDDGGLTGALSWDGGGVRFAAFAVGADGTMYAANLGGDFVTSTDDGLTWTPAGTTPVSCLEAGAGGLYGCTNAISTGFPVGTSSDGALTFAGLYAFADTGGPIGTCAPGTPTRDLCDALWPAQRIALGIDTDAGVEADAGDGARGHCGCAIAPRVSGARGGPAASAWAGAAALLLTLAALLRSTYATRITRGKPPHPGVRSPGN